MLFSERIADSRSGSEQGSPSLRGSRKLVEEQVSSETQPDRAAAEDVRDEGTADEEKITGGGYPRVMGAGFFESCAYVCPCLSAKKRDSSADSFKQDISSKHQAMKNLLPVKLFLSPDLSSGTL